MRRLCAISLCVALVACSSSGQTGQPPVDAGFFPNRDAGTPVIFDAGVDAGFPPDSGVGADAGFPQDAGFVPDAGLPADAGNPNDGGPRVGDVCGGSACSGTQVLICGQNQRFEAGEDCALRQMRCESGNCTGCLPGARRCGGQTSIEECNSDGMTYSTVAVCDQDRVCADGQCVAAGPCGITGKKSNQGCDYWAVDLPNADVAPLGTGVSPATAQYAVVISNTDPSNAARVRITDWTGTGDPVVVADENVAAQDIRVFNLPAKNADQCGAAMGCANVGYKAYRIQTSIPVVAYQFNPLNNTDEAFSNDASLLIPSNALDKEYIVVTADAQDGQNRNGMPAPWGAYVSVVGTEDMASTVTVTVPAGVNFSPPQGATVSGQTITATLQKYQVLTVLSQPSNPDQTGGGNLSGARVSSTGKVAVFSGNMAIVVPHGTTDARCCADHTEEQMIPVSTWGNQYVAARSLPRRLGVPQTICGGPSTKEPDLWRITAAQNSTTFTYVTNGSSNLTGQPTSLNAGQSREFRSLGDFIVTANKPFSLAQFVVSSNVAYDLGVFGICQVPCTLSSDDSDDAFCTQQYATLSRCAPDGLGGGVCQPVGDPSMTLIPPIRQFRQNYIFLTPLDYNRDYAVIIAPSGTQVELDGALVPAGSFQTIGALGGVTFQRAQVTLTTQGRHVLTATQPVGLLVGGYDRDVSYGYPGGLNLEASSGADGGT